MSFYRVSLAVCEGRGPVDLNLRHLNFVISLSRHHSSCQRHSDVSHDISYEGGGAEASYWPIFAATLEKYSCTKASLRSKLV